MKVMNLISKKVSSPSSFLRHKCSVNIPFTSNNIFKGIFSMKSYSKKYSPCNKKASELKRRHSLAHKTL